MLRIQEKMGRKENDNRIVGESFDIVKTRQNGGFIYSVWQSQ